MRPDIIDLRDWAYDLERTLELLQADTKHALDLHSVQVANRLNVLAGVREFPVRVKCATLAWHTMHAAMSGEAEISTE